MFISAGCGATGARNIAMFQKFIVLKWESSFTFGLSIAEITDYIKKFK